MARPPSQHIQQVFENLMEKIRSSHLRPGDPFPSARAVAQRHQISYQTAHRLLARLVGLSLLERRTGAGTFVAGARANPSSVALIFHPRARRARSFGGRLEEVIRAALDAAGIRWGRRQAHPRPAEYPVYWEMGGPAREVARRKVYGLLLNEPAPPGLAGAYLDSIAVDDFSGGVSAGELLRDHFQCRRPACLAGPAGDPRSDDRMRGFLAVFPAAPVVHAPSWFAEEAGPSVRRLRRLKADGVFCANDRLAQAVVQAQRDGARPMLRGAVVGFDDAPIAQDLNLTTIAIPWETIAASAADVIRRRLRGETLNTRRIIIAPRPVVRSRGWG